MIKRRDYLAILTIVFMMITSITGILSLDFTYSYEFINQYGHSVQMYGYGIYAFDTYFQAPISIGTDICILFVLVPVFIYSYVNYARKNDKVSELKLISVYAVALYYGASIAFGLTYNQLFLIYLGLFSSSLFGMFLHIKNIEWEETCSISKGLKVFLTLSGVALIVAWLPDIIPSLIKGTTLQLIGVYTTVITYVLDMGIISPLCFVCIYLLNKKSPLGTVLLAIMLKSSMIIGIMMISQTVCQLASGCNLPLGAILTKSFSFVLLGGFAFYFNQKMYKELIG